VLNCSIEEAEDVANKMIGKKLITKQTGAAGRMCSKVVTQYYNGTLLASGNML